MSTLKIMDGERAKRYASWADGFSKMTIEELIAAFNRQVGNTGWGTARADYLHALQHAFENCGYDCSSFLTREPRAMSLQRRIALDGQRIVQRT